MIAHHIHNNITESCELSICQRRAFARNVEILLIFFRLLHPYQRKFLSAYNGFRFLSSVEGGKSSVEGPMSRVKSRGNWRNCTGYINVKKHLSVPSRERCFQRNYSGNYGEMLFRSASESCIHSVSDTCFVAVYFSKLIFAFWFLIRSYITQILIMHANQELP